MHICTQSTSSWAYIVVYRSKGKDLPALSGSDDSKVGEIFFDVRDMPLSLPTSSSPPKPNLLTEDGTAALSTYAFSESGEYWAYGVSLSVICHSLATFCCL